MWLTQFDRGEFSNEEVEAALVADYDAKIATLERKVGQLTMELELVRKTLHLRFVSGTENFSIVTGPKPCPIRQECEVIGLPRSTFYCRASEAGDVLSDLQVKHPIESIQDELPGYGYRRVTHELRRRGHLINHKRIARLIKMHA
jgi:hypothetical protein